MLFGYPAVGFANNWLHDTLIEIINTDIHCIDSNSPTTEWPACIPEARRNALGTRHGLRDRRQRFFEAYRDLNSDQQGRVKSAMLRQNALPAIFADGQPCDRLLDLPVPFRDSLHDLFEFSFSLLADLGLRDENYREIYTHQQFRDKVCAFCGVEILDAPDQKRESLDHYLPISRYPFAGVNFRNLVPMGNKCNSRYKGHQDIIVDDETGDRRLCFDPYSAPAIHLCLKNSRPFEGEVVDLVTCPDWVVEWEGGDASKLQTWEAVFKIVDRYKKSSLDPNFRSWIDHFREWAARNGLPMSTVEQARQALLDFAATVVPQGYSDSAFLKRATMQMLAHRCDNSENGERVSSWLRGLVDDFKTASAP